MGIGKRLINNVFLTFLLCMLMAMSLFTPWGFIGEFMLTPAGIVVLFILLFLEQTFMGL